jgi:hypothetical protein
VGLGTPLQYPDQTAALQLGYFSTNSVLGSHVTRMLAGTGTEADPGLVSIVPLPLGVVAAETRRRARTRDPD